MKSIFKNFSLVFLKGKGSSCHSGICYSLFPFPDSELVEESATFLNNLPDSTQSKKN